MYHYDTSSSISNSHDSCIFTVQGGGGWRKYDTCRHWEYECQAFAPGFFTPSRYISCTEYFAPNGPCGCFARKVDILQRAAVHARFLLSIMSLPCKGMHSPSTLLIKTSCYVLCKYTLSSCSQSMIWSHWRSISEFFREIVIIATNLNFSSTVVNFQIHNGGQPVHTPAPCNSGRRSSISFQARECKMWWRGVYSTRLIQVCGLILPCELLMRVGDSI